MENEKMILGVVSAYGTMSEPGSRYRVVIRGKDVSDLKKGLEYFLKKEFRRAMETEEIREELDNLDLQPWEINNEISKAVSSELKDGIMEADFMKNLDGERKIISLPSLLTDYHVEIRMIDKPSELAFCKEMIVVTAYGHECMGEEEFPDIISLINPASETDEEGKPIKVDYIDNFHGRIGMRGSELNNFLLGSESHNLKVIDYPLYYHEDCQGTYKPTGEISLDKANEIGKKRFHILNLSEAEMGTEDEEYSICQGYSHWGPVMGGSGTRQVEILKRILEKVSADCIILPDNVARRHINTIIRNPKIKSVEVSENCKLFSMEGNTLCNKKKTIEIFKPR